MKRGESRGGSCDSIPRSRSTDCHHSRPVCGSARALILSSTACGTRPAAHWSPQPAERPAQRALRRAPARGARADGLAAALIWVWNARSRLTLIWGSSHARRNSLQTPGGGRHRISLAAPPGVCRGKRRRPLHQLASMASKVRRARALGRSDAQRRPRDVALQHRVVFRSRRPSAKKSTVEGRSRRRGHDAVLDEVPFGERSELKRIRDIVHQQQSIVQWKLERSASAAARTSTVLIVSHGMSAAAGEVTRRRALCGEVSRRLSAS